VSKWRWRNVKRKMDVKKIVPQNLWCQPENPLEPKHQFPATKVYLLSDEEGHETAVVICPKHLQPIPVEAVRHGLQGGKNDSLLSKQK